MSFVYQFWPKPFCEAQWKRVRRQGRQKKKWEDNIRQWTGLDFAKSQRAMEKREKWRKLVVKSSMVPPTTPSGLRIGEGERRFQAHSRCRFGFPLNKQPLCPAHCRSDLLGKKATVQNFILFTLLSLLPPITYSQKTCRSVTRETKDVS